MSKQSEFLVFNIESDEITSILSSPRNIVVPAAASKSNNLSARLSPRPLDPRRATRGLAPGAARDVAPVRGDSLFRARGASPADPAALRAPRSRSRSRTRCRVGTPPRASPPRPRASSRCLPGRRLGRRARRAGGGDARAGSGAALHVVAFSGGVDSSLAAYLVHRAFGEDARPPPADASSSPSPASPSPASPSCVAAVGVSPALPTPRSSRPRAGSRTTSASPCGRCGRTRGTCRSTSPTRATRASRLQAHPLRDPPRRRERRRVVARPTPSDDDAILSRSTPEHQPERDTRDTRRGGGGGAAGSTRFDRSVQRHERGRPEGPDAAGDSVRRAPPRRKPRRGASGAGSDVRRLARVAGLPNWDLAAAPCLRAGSRRECRRSRGR